MAQRRKPARRRAGPAADWKAEWRGALSLAALGLFALAFSGFADGTWPPLDAFRSLWIPIGTALAGLGLVLLAFRARRGIAAILAGAFFVALALKVALLDGRPVAPGEAPDLRVLTLNALITNPRDEAVTARIVAGDYDIVAVQEAPMLWDQLPALAATYPYRLGCETPQACDMIVLSKRPLRDVRWTPFDTRPYRMVTGTTEIDGTRVGIAAVHLTKPHHDGAQRYETYRVIRALERLPADAVLMGDFNAAPWTGLLGWLRGATGFEHVAGYRPTAPARLGPLGIPIDHVMVRGGVEAARIAVLEEALGSNHFAVEADLYLDRDR